MDIHGAEIVVETRLGVEEALKEAVKAIESIWPAAVVDISNLTWVDVYSSGDAEVAWSAYGWNERYARDLVSLLADGDGHLTLVVENKTDPTLVRIIEAVQAALTG